MRIPFGFKVNQLGKYLLQLVKNVHGLKDAGRTWNQHLKKELLERDFKQSKVDPCVFFKGNLIIVIYVDDVIAFCPTDEPIDNFIQSMQAPEPRAFILEDQGPLKDYLGLEILHTDDGKIHVTQKHLINKVIKTANFNPETVKSVATPASGPLHQDLKSKVVDPKHAPFHYRSLIGQLNYLAATSRPDITLAVHQCAKFCNNPREVHYTAAKRIVRYLHGTKDKGMILNIQDPKMECYADADFASQWDKNNPDDASNVRSRSGYIIKFAGCPLAWQSKLQTEIALSTTEAEYISLSMATRSLLHILHLIQELKDHEIDLVLPKTEVHAKCFEDNAGCLELATAPKLRPRTRHIAIKYHHFLSHVKNDENPNGILELKYTQSEDQQADLFTKALT